MKNLKHLCMFKEEVASFGGKIETGINWDWAIFPTQKQADEFLNKYREYIFGLGLDDKEKSLKLNNGWGFRAR